MNARRSVLKSSHYLRGTLFATNECVGATPYGFCCFFFEVGRVELFICTRSSTAPVRNDSHSPCPLVEVAALLACYLCTFISMLIVAINNVLAYCRNSVCNTMERIRLDRVLL